MLYNTNFPKKRKRKTTKIGTWNKPTGILKKNELAKCWITKVDIATGEILEVIEPTSQAKPILFGAKKYGL